MGMYAEDFSNQFRVDLNYLLNSSFNNGFCSSHYQSEIYLSKLFEILNLITYFMRKSLISELEFCFSFLKKHWITF
jgi:hypothetical protein